MELVYKVIIARTINDLDDIIITYNLFNSTVIQVIRESKNELILVLCTDDDSLVKIYLRT